MIPSQAKKLANAGLQRYISPRLICYGSVRNLTGGSGVRARDAGTQTTRFT